MAGVTNLSKLFSPPLVAANNLSDLMSATAALTALGLGATASAELARIGAPALTDWRQGLIELVKTRTWLGQIGAFADGFFDQSNVDVANSINATYDATNKLYTNLDSSFRALLHFDGANGSTTISDDVGHAFTASGGAALSTAQAAFGSASLLISANGDYVSTPASADFGFGTGDFQIHGRYRPSTVSGNPNLFDTRTSSNTANAGISAFLTNGKLAVYDGASNSAILTGTTSFTANGSFFDWEISRASGTLYLFVNGNLEGSVASTHNFGTSQPFIFGANAAPTACAPGYHDECMVKKVAGHTAAYTPATSAFSASIALDLRSAALALPTAPSKGSMMVIVNPLNGATITPQTNLIGSISQNGTATTPTYTQATLALSGVTTKGLQIYEANGFALPGAGQGQALRSRVQLAAGTGGQIIGVYAKAA